VRREKGLNRGYPALPRTHNNKALLMYLRRSRQVGHDPSPGGQRDKLMFLAMTGGGSGRFGRFWEGRRCDDRSTDDHSSSDSRRSQLAEKSGDVTVGGPPFDHAVMLSRGCRSSLSLHSRRNALEVDKVGRR